MNKIENINLLPDTEPDSGDYRRGRFAVLRKMPQAQSLFPRGQDAFRA